MKYLDTESYKGVRDFYPEDMFVQDYIHAVWHAVLQSYGYEHYNASILEPSELYEGKTSTEIVSDQTYTFTDRGDRRVTLRPEMTPTVTRMVAKKQKSLSFPLRWYSIPNVFRYERPQKGRLREHWQLNVDIFGLDGIDAEAELIEIAYGIMRRFGMRESDFVVKINDRALLDGLMKSIGLDEAQKKTFKYLLDKKNKISDFNEQMERLIGRPFNDTLSPNQTIANLTKKLQARGITNIVFDPLLVRGFDYYTGIVFEIFDTNPENSRSLFGGGRYDNLLALFGGEKIGTVGFGMGDVTIREALSIRGLLPTRFAPAHVSICTTDAQVYDFATQCARTLRQSGLDVIVNYDEKKIGDQIKRADKKGIPFVICIGTTEIQTKKVTVKNIKTRNEKVVDISEAAAYICNHIPRT